MAATLQWPCCFCYGNRASNWLKIAAADWGGRPKEPVLKKTQERLVGIAGVYVPMSVADANLI